MVTHMVEVETSCTISWLIVSDCCAVNPPCCSVLLWIFVSGTVETHTHTHTHTHTQHGSLCRCEEGQGSSRRENLELLDFGFSGGTFGARLVVFEEVKDGLAASSSELGCLLCVTTTACFMQEEVWSYVSGLTLQISIFMKLRSIRCVLMRLKLPEI